MVKIDIAICSSVYSGIEYLDFGFRKRRKTQKEVVQSRPVTFSSGGHSATAPMNSLLTSETKIRTNDKKKPTGSIYMVCLLFITGTGVM